MKTNYTKQHIVPKCYLDRFSEHQDGKFIIGTRFVTKDGKIRFFTQSTTDIGYIKNFYDVTDKKDPKYWEHFLANKVDSLCSRRLDNIISSIMLSGENYFLNDDDKTTLSSIIIAQILRIPESLNYVIKDLYPQVSTNTKNRVYLEFPDFITNKYKSEIDAFQMSEQNIKEGYFNFIFTEEHFNNYVEILKQRFWLILINSIGNELPFITSDNPVLIENITNHDSIGLFKNGLQNPSTILYFPITPSIAVVNYSNNGIFSAIASKRNGSVYRVEESKFIINKNIRVMNNAYAHTFIPQPLFSRISKPS